MIASIDNARLLFSENETEYWGTCNFSCRDITAFQGIQGISHFHTKFYLNFDIYKLLAVPWARCY